MNMSDPNNYLILRQRIQEYVAKLHGEAADFKSIAKERELPAFAALAGTKEVIADDLSDILQTIY